MGKGLLLMVSLVIISTIDLNDWMPGCRAPGLFVFPPLNSREKERVQGVGTLFSLDNATLLNFLFTQKRANRGSSHQSHCGLEMENFPKLSTISNRILEEGEE